MTEDFYHTAKDGTGPRQQPLRGHWRSLSVVIVTLGFILLPVTAARSEKSEYEVKAVFLERFTRFVTWPDTAGLDRPGARFVLCVAGSNPFGSILLTLYAQRFVKERPVKLLIFESEPGRAPLSSCHLLFISASERRNLANILEGLREQPILSVGDTTGFAQRGVHINMYLAEKKIRFEINEAAVRRSGLKISYRLLQTAKIVTSIGP